MVVSGLISAHFICSSVIIALLLDRGVCDGGKKTQFSTSNPWFPSGPPPTKPPMDEETSKALQKVLPLVTFDCKGKTGYFPDSKFHCEVFHYCKLDGTRNSFHCPQNSLFNQLTMVCEEKTAFNSRLCKEGSIGEKRGKPLNSKPTPKKYISPTVSKHSLNHHHQTRPAVSVNRTGPGYVMTLEDLLGYMNSDHRTSGFYASQGIHDPSGTLVKLPPTEKKEVSTTTTVKPKAFSKLVNTTVVRKEAPKKMSEYEDVSIEYDAIEGRKRRKHVRVGRVLDVDVAAPVLTKAKFHSHVSARSPTENPPDTTTADQTPTTTPAAPGGPSLFTADRSKAKDIRKRRRNLNRRKKVTTDATTDATTTESVRVERRGSESTTLDYARSKSDRAEKEDQEPEMSQSWLGYSHSGKVEPYTLPPLPIEENDRLETTTQRYEKEATTKFPKRKPSGRKKNQWYKTTPVPGDEFLGSRFGEKISDSEHGTNVKTKRPSEYEDFKTHSEDKSSEYTPTFTPKYRKENKYGEERFFHFPLPSTNRERLEKTPQDFFPPPRAEPRELPPPQPQPSHLYESSAERPTTEIPYKTTQSYMVRPNTRVRDHQDKEHHWTLSADKRKAKRKKIQVGSTFSSHGSEPTTESPVTERPSGRRGLPTVNTEAHQHLLKLMNDFFAMSSIPKDPTERATEHDKSIDLDSSAPAFERTSEEDMVAGSETVTDEVEELPSELLEVVDFITGHSKEEEEEKDQEQDMSHEVIKISGQITNAHLKEILSNGNFELPKRRKKTRKESIQKIVVLPSEEKENYRDISEIAKFASTRMKPKYNFKHAPADKPTITMVSQHAEPTKSTVVSAKKIPIRVIYKDHTSEPTSPRVVKQPNLKVIRSRLPKPSYQVIQNGRINPTRPYNQQPHPKPRPSPQPRTQQRPKIVIQPKSVFPPHPPPLSSKNPMNFRFGFPFSAGSHPLLSHAQYRRKRSTPEEAERRQGRPPHFMPFPRQIFPGFNPKFVPTFSPFKNMFSPMHTSGSSVSPFAFPRPQYRAPPIFKPVDSRPAPVRHITQAGHQTVIVEEVPVPIHVEVPDPNMLRPVHPGNLQKNLVNPFSNNQYRSPSPPAITTPPLVHSFQGRLPGNPNYRPMGMPSNVRPPVFNYQPSVPFSPPLPPSFTNQGQMYALGVSNKPFGPVTGNTPGPFQHFDVHANAYPNFPYFQGAFTTPLSDDSVPGRIMYSGYKPPKPTSGYQQPRTTSMPNRDKKETYPRSSKPPTPRPKPTQSYYHVTKRPTTEYISYNTPTRSVIHTSPNGLREQTELRSIRPSYNMETTPSIDGGRKRRPYRKRRPRPRTTTAIPTVHYSRDISPTPPPPEQIPPPPSEFTSLPLKQDFTPVIHNSKAVSTNIETSSLYPPAGYYGKDQLGQFFDSSSKSYKKASSSKPYEHNDVGETTSSAEIDESVTSISSEDSDQPAFGTRLRSKPQSQRRRKKTRQEVQSPTQRTEVRVRATANPEEMKKESEQPRSRSYRKHENRESQTPQKRPRPAQYRSRSRPSQKPGVNSYRYEDNQGFYSVPTGIQGLVDPSQVSSPTRGGNTDMFGIPHPEMDSVYSMRPQGGGGGGFSSSFFSVPKEVEQQQQSPLHKMDVKAIPKSARDFFSNAAKEATAQLHKAKENEEQEGSSTPAPEQDGKHPTVRKLRKPKRKIRYNPNNKSTTEATTEKSEVSSTQTTTTVETTTEPRPTYMPPTTNQNDVKENSVFKQRSPLLPKAMPEISKSLLNGKIDIKKLNATISTSVSVSSQENRQPEEAQKRVFSSQNGGGLAVVRGGQKRKRQKQQKVDEASDANKAKYEIAASVLDIIKATTETEKNGAGFYSSRYGVMDSSTPSPLSDAWVSNPALIDIDYKRQES